MKKLFIFLSVSAIMLILQGCNIAPSLTYNFKPTQGSSDVKPVKKLVVYKSYDKRPHVSTTPIYKAYIPFYPFVKLINKPENFVLALNGNSFNYEENFSELVAMDLDAAGIANNVVTEDNLKKETSDYYIKLSLKRLDWQADYTMYGLSYLGYLPQALGAPSSFGMVSLAFNAEVYAPGGKLLGEKEFSCDIPQNGWIYYYSGYLRALTKAYIQLSPQFRKFVINSISN